MQTPEHDYKEGVHDEALETMIAGGAWRCLIYFEVHRKLFPSVNTGRDTPAETRTLLRR